MSLQEYNLWYEYIVIFSFHLRTYESILKHYKSLKFSNENINFIFPPLLSIEGELFIHHQNILLRLNQRPVQLVDGNYGFY